MLHSLSRTITSEGRQTNQLSIIIAVISAAQAAGVVVGRPRQSRSTRSAHSRDNGNIGNEHGGIQGSFFGGGMAVQQIFDGREGSSYDNIEDEDDENRSRVPSHPAGSIRSRINNALDAANVLQFNSLVLGPYQVEVLFVLCTLLGGRRKIDAQETLMHMGVVGILDDTFERLPWDTLSSTREVIKYQKPDHSTVTHDDPDQQTYGIHGPGCECTPESALCVQYLRLLHNFCDRDCDNYSGRRLLLSREEREFIFETTTTGSDYEISEQLPPGLLSKLITAFMGESDESPYRFWLASCIEAYLRGSSNKEQLFVAKTGLMEHLLADVTSQRLFCSGSLQTSFDLLGELCKGNLDVLTLLVKDLDETRFQKLMSVAAANLVDSNVFIRSLLLGIERLSVANTLIPSRIESQFDGEIKTKIWESAHGLFSRSYLTHSWWEPTQVGIKGDSWLCESSAGELLCDRTRPSDWFPTSGSLEAYNLISPSHPTTSTLSRGSHTETSRFGWIFTPEGGKISSATNAPNTLERLSWFLATNQTRLLRDLLEVVDLRNINHENICCLNTAVVIAIFAHRRKELHLLLEDLRTVTDKEHHQHETLNRSQLLNNDVIDSSFVRAMKDTDQDSVNPRSSYNHRAALGRKEVHRESFHRSDILQNFREVLWFWVEYYTHRGRDRLSLEFSSHLRFSEWMEVVSLLSADNGTPTSLMSRPLPLPRSPYFQRAT
jgi:hypothetical protein